MSSMGGRMDGKRRNIIMDCPFCGKHEKYGIYIGESKNYHEFGASQCFRCGEKHRTLKETLDAIGLMELMPKETTDLSVDFVDTLGMFDEEEIDDTLHEVEMPEGYKRTFKNRYLRHRGFMFDDYEYFPCGTTRGMNRRFDDYVILEIIMEGVRVGYIGRHIWDKQTIDEHNEHNHFKIRRYNNSTDNEFGKMLYNYDSIVPYETDTVILCEGCFDVISLVRKLDLYDYTKMVPVATFGKKISMEQLYLLQKKFVSKIIIGYDADATDTVHKVAQQLDEYFDTYVAQLNIKNGKDWDEMSYNEIYDVFCNHIVTVREFNLK